MRRNWILVGTAASLWTAAALAQSPSVVWCGSFTPIRFKVAAGGLTADRRANTAMEVINKHLGGRIGRVATRMQGKNILLTLNGDKVATVTPADAKAENSKSTSALAAKWSRSLSVAFNESKALK
ncbi:MAG: hypothetical protein FJX77_00270 [Armatimonadetes bacterium]|nr:hypothetical protein [Armatimonadota bacterium]